MAIGGTATLGIASFVTRLVSPITLLFEASWRVSYPALSRLIDTGEDPGPTLTRALRLSSSVMGLGVAGLVASVPALVPSLFGARWNATIPAMPWALGALMVGGPMYVCVSGYLSAIGRADSLLKVSVIVSTVWLGVGIPLVPSFGAAGAATGWFVSSCLGLVLFGAKLSRLAHVPVARTLAPSLLAVVIAGAVGWLAADSFEPTLLIAVLGAGIGAVSYLAILGLLQPAAIREQRSLAQRLTRRGHAASEPA